MNLSQKLNRRIFAGLCVLLFFGGSFIAFSMLKAARQDQSENARLEVVENSEENEESNELSRRSEGLRFRRLSLQDENGVVDPDGLRNAKKQIEKMKTVQEQRRQARDGQIQEAGVAPDSWDWLGPGNIGGRIRTIAIHPTNANNMWVGSVSGGIWRTTNAGASWFPVNDFMANLAVTTIIINPTNTNIMYAGTGEGFSTQQGDFVDTIQGAGIFRSNDGGVTWNQLESTNNANFNFINRLSISPIGTTLLAATNTGVWRSTDGGATWDPRTSNRSQDIDFHPTNNERAIVGENSVARFSINGGETWTTANFTPGISGRVELAYAPSNGLIVYASVDRTTGVAPVPVSNGEVYRSIDGGVNYSRVNVGNNLLGGQGFYDNALWVNPQNPNYIIVGGVLPYRSVDSGTTFTAIGNSATNLPHADHHIFVSHPGFNNITNRTVFFGNDGGIHRMDDVSVDSAEGWTELNNNLGITQFYGAAGNLAGTIVGGTQDNGTLKFNGASETWTSTAGGDGGYVTAEPTNPNYFYGETQNLGVFRSSNGGQSATSINAGISDVPPNCTQTLAPICQTNFIAPIKLDPNDQLRLLAGGWSLWRTNDAVIQTPQWTSIKNPTGGNSPISAITISPINSDWAIVGHNNGDIFQTFFATTNNPITTWSKIDTAGLPDRFITRLLIDTTRAPNWIYATFGGFNANNVYVSKNLGVSWTDVTGTGATGLPDVPVRSLDFHPSNANLLYAGTEVGIFTSENAGASWDLPNSGPANVSVDELFWMGGDLIAATYGRGIFRASGGIYVDCNFTGVSDGTFAHPYKTVNAAINAVNRYTPIWLKPCSYSETINTNKRLEIRSLGGAAIISP